MDSRQGIAIGIALQTRVLKACPVHQQLYCDDEVDPGSAFALAADLLRHQRPYVGQFFDDTQALTTLLSATLESTPSACPDCPCHSSH